MIPIDISKYKGIKIAGISVVTIATGIVVYSIWHKNRLNNKLTKLKIVQLNSEGFHTQEWYDNLFSSTQKDFDKSQANTTTK